MADTCTLQITFDVHADPLTGTVRDERGQTASFTGYIDLIAAIERHRVRGGERQGERGRREERPPKNGPGERCER